MQDPDKRYASMGNFATALEELAAQAADPLATPYEGLEIALTEGRWDDALQRADEIIAQDAGYRDVQVLRERAVEGKAEAERAQWAAQWREQALEAERRGDVEAARVATQRWLEMAPESSEAKALLERVKPGAQEAPEKFRLDRVPVWGWVFGGVTFLVLVTYLTMALGMNEESMPEVVEVEKLVTVERFVTATPASTHQGNATDRPTLLPTETPTTAPTDTPTTAPTDTPTPLHTWTRPADEIVMVYVPGGTFDMGRTKGAGDEQPVHDVTLDGFWLDQTEVTNAQFVAFLNEEGNQEEGGVTWLDVDEARLIELSGGEFQLQSVYADHPVFEVSWYGAKTYCEWAGARLPTEAEWEYAARGPEGYTYPWGNTSPTCDLVQYGSCSGWTVPVGTFPDGASWCGALDMAGNVWEWVADWYDADYYERSPSENPIGPEDGSSKVLRGGSFPVSRRNVRGTTRDGASPNTRHFTVGFRCARDSQ
jgi:formylglycine-generating enzyme required for sulfatase activity